MTSLLPGIRDLRAPMSAGLLWLGVAVVLLAPRADRILAPSPDTEALTKLVRSWPVSLIIPVALAGAFLLGTVANVIVLFLAARAERFFRKTLQRMTSAQFVHITGDQYTATRPEFIYKSASSIESAIDPVSGTAHSLVYDATLATLGRAGVPGSSAQIFPVELVTRSIRYLAAQLSVSAPDLYQSYDRLKSESELRIVIAPPLLALAVVAPLNGKPWIVMVATLASAVLLGQSVSQHRAANDILANAAYLDQVTLPAVQAVAETVNSLPDTPGNNGEWMGAIVVALDKRGFFDEARLAVFQIAEHEDLEEAAWYLWNNDMHHFNVLKREVQRVDPANYSKLLRRLEIRAHRLESGDSEPEEQDAKA